jgi:PIN domain nuclease of toxin-antitoxin system
MRYLLDTHTFIWWNNEPEKLSAQVLTLCQESNSQLYVSMVSLWEMQIKLQLGKLKLHQSLEDIVQSQIIENDIQLLDITAPHIFKLSMLEEHHKDPFDRLLISQSIHEDMPILSKDGVFGEYPVRVIW